MKPISALVGLTLVLCAAASAQDNGDRIVVPAGNGRRVLNCSLLNGAITVKTHAGGEIILSGGESSHDREERQSGGLHRIGVSSRGLEAVVDDNVVTVRNHNGNGAVTLTVPVETSLKLRSLSGSIEVDGVHGEIEVHTQNGHVTLSNISGTVNADSQNGPIRVTMDRVDATKPLAFSTLNGLVDLTFPTDLKANLTVKTSHGPVYSDFDVTLGGSRSISERNNSGDGRYVIRMDSTIRGTIGGGGVDLAIRTLNGGVYIRKKK